MDALRRPSPLRVALRTLLWMGAGLACMGAGKAGVEAWTGIGLAPLSGALIAVLGVPVAFASRAIRRLEADLGWTGTLRMGAIGVGLGLLLDGSVALASADPPSGVVDALLNAAVGAGSILLPRLVLRAVAPGVFAGEASIEGFRLQNGRLATVFVCSAATAGVLVSIAVPNFRTFGLRAKASEARVEIEAIRDAQEAWYAEHGHHLTATALPLGPPGPHRASFDAEAHTASGFARLGWPEESNRHLYCQYAVAVENGAERQGGYTIEAICDIDGDGELMALGWLKPSAGSRVGVPAPFGYCTVRGVLPKRGSGGDERLLDRFGPCDASSGVTRF